MLNGVFEIRFALLGLLGFITFQRALEQGGTQVLLHLGAQFGISYSERLSKRNSRRIEILQRIFCGPFVKLQRGQSGPMFQRLFIFLSRFFVVPFLVKFLTRGCVCRAGNHQYKSQPQSSRAIQRFAAAVVDEDRGHQQGDAQTERPLVTFDGTSGCTGIDFLLLEFSKPLHNQAVHVGGTVLQTKIETTGRFRDVGESFFVQARFYKLPIRSFDKLRLLAGERNERTLRRADPHGENAHGSRRLAGSLHGVHAEILSVREDHQAAAFALALSKGLGCGANGLCEICAAERNDGGVEFVE